MFFKKRLILLVTLLMTSCASEYMEVEFPFRRIPSKRFKELRTLGFTRPTGLNQKQRSKLLKGLGKCVYFDKVKDIPAFLNISFKSTKKLLKSLNRSISRSPELEKVNGFLSFYLTRDQESTKLSSEKLTLLDDTSSFQWYPGRGLTFSDFHAEDLDGIELAPKVVLKNKNVYEKHVQFRLVAFILLYNRVINKLVLTRKLEINATLNTYSTKTVVTKGWVREILIDNFLRQTQFFTCPEDEIVERKLYYSDEDEDREADKINRGVDLVDESRWERAASEWSDVLKKRSRHPQALHNMAVYNEFKGEITEAARFYKKVAQTGKNLGEVQGLGRLIARFHQEYDFPQFPEIIHRSSGHWLSVKSNGEVLKLGKTYQIYSLSRKYRPEDQTVFDVSISEVGSIRISQKRGELYFARIIEHLDHREILPGQVLVLK